MRPSCLYCVSKHVAQAVVLMGEAVQGYPLYRWLAIGHLAEAGDESVAYFPALAAQIRNERLTLMGQEYVPEGTTYDPRRLMQLLEEVRRVSVADLQEADAVFLKRLLMN
jgi:hypothetical protein